MNTVRLLSANEMAHTKENIFAKLDTDLTDSERKSYLNILLATPETTQLLTLVALEWKNKLLEQQIKIEVLKERIRLRSCDIELRKKYKIDDNKIESIQKSIDKDVIDLRIVQSAFDTSVVRAEKAMIIVVPALNEAKQQMEEEITRFTNVKI